MHLLATTISPIERLLLGNAPATPALMTHVNGPSESMAAVVAAAAFVRPMPLATTNVPPGLPIASASACTAVTMSIRRDMVTLLRAKQYHRERFQIVRHCPYL